MFVEHEPRNQQEGGDDEETYVCMVGLFICTVGLFIVIVGFFIGIVGGGEETLELRRIAIVQ